MEFTLSYPLRFFAEFILSRTTRFFTAFRMTGGEGLRMTGSEGFARAKIFCKLSLRGAKRRSNLCQFSPRIAGVAVTLLTLNCFKCYYKALKLKIFIN
jgi:hypothetical protein